jgi:predicted amidohydrolase
MKISVAQTRPARGHIQQNIDNHLRFIEQAIAEKADVIFFPELSLTGYEPELAKELASTQDDERLDIFQTISDNNQLMIGVGLPTRENDLLFVSTIIFQPGKERLTYSKQHLYPTELEVFTPGQNKIYLDIDGVNVIAPTICYELSVPEHSENAHANHANVYIASVMNSVGGVDHDLQKLSDIARTYHMNTFMANYVGQSGGNECAGKTSAWKTTGELAGQLSPKDEGLLIFETGTEEVTEIALE